MIINPGVNTRVLFEIQVIQAINITEFRRQRNQNLKRNPISSGLLVLTIIIKTKRPTNASHRYHKKWPTP